MQEELISHSASQGNLFRDLDSNHTRVNGNLGWLTRAVLQRYLTGNVFCFGAASNLGVLLSQHLASRVHFEDEVPSMLPAAEGATSHVVGGERQISKRMTVMKIR